MIIIINNSKLKIKDLFVYIIKYKLKLYYKSSNKQAIVVKIF